MKRLTFIVSRFVLFMSTEYLFSLEQMIFILLTNPPAFRYNLLLFKKSNRISTAIGANYCVLFSIAILQEIMLIKYFGGLKRRHLFVLKVSIFEKRIFIYE